MIDVAKYRRMAMIRELNVGSLKLASYGENSGCNIWNWNHIAGS